MIIVIVLVLIGLLVATAAVTGALVTRQTRDPTSPRRAARSRRRTRASSRQLYDQSDANVAASYNFTGGPLGPDRIRRLRRPAVQREPARSSG